MGALSAILRSLDGDKVSFWCPGCDKAHAIKVSQVHQAGGAWGWNGDVDAPTFTPSILVRSGHYLGGAPGCWCTFNADAIARGKEPSGFECGVCHSFVTDGQIQFLGDCTHALAGQTVPLPEWPR